MNLIPYVFASLLLLTGTPNIVAEGTIPQQKQELSVAGQISANKGIVQALVDKYSKQYKVSGERMMRTLECENPAFDPYLQSYVKADTYNGRELSFGVAQIHLPSHRELTIEQITDLDFAVEFMAKEFAKGNAKIWSCYRNIYGIK